MRKICRRVNQFCYLVDQVKAGAQMLQVFDSNLEFLTPDLFAKFCVPYLNQLCDRVKSKLKSDGIEPVPMVCQLSSRYRIGAKNIIIDNSHLCPIVAV